jgi:hypothetical protein
MLLAESSVASFVLLPASARLGGFSSLNRVDACLTASTIIRASFQPIQARFFATLVEQCTISCSIVWMAFFHETSRKL